MRVYTARWVLPISAPPIRDGAVGVAPDGWITYVGPADAAPAGERHPLGDAVLLPGLVAFTVDSAATHAGVAATAAAGITTRAATIGAGALEAGALDVFRLSGLRGFAYLAPDVPPDAADRLRRARLAGHVQLGIATGPPHEFDEDALLDRCARAVADRMPLAVAAGASPAEVEYLREAAGPLADARRAAGIDVVRRAHSTVHLMAELGVAAVARPLLVGGAWFDESDIALAGYYDCAVAYVPPHVAAPCSAAALLEAGVRTALAVEDPGDLLPTAAALARSPADALHLLTLGGARALELADDVGSLEPGKAADLCVFPLSADDLAVADAQGPAHALCTRPRRRATRTFVQGRTVVGEGA